MLLWLEVFVTWALCVSFFLIFWRYLILPEERD
jgi:hypothetical protein